MHKESGLEAQYCQYCFFLTRCSNLSLRFWDLKERLIEWSGNFLGNITYSVFSEVLIFSPLLPLAPCAAGNVAAIMDCYNNTAEVSWSPATGANSYMVTAVGSDGHRASCETDEHQCDLTDLQCGQMYEVSLTAISDHCRTETRTNATFSTRELSNISSPSFSRVNKSLSFVYCL